MGVVYRAQDTRLGRQVAIKILPEGFAQDEERLARFEREAQVVAQLNHPNISALYDVGHEGRQRYLVMELVEGETLDERIRRGVGVDEAIEIARQIAEGLETAHAAGIVHRDLKPANVKITPDGQVKVLDFGLAKAGAGATGARPELTHSPTLTAQMTDAGIILGTAAYMCPEQARGQEADERADVWSWGVILFEMLTGGQLFNEPTVSDTLAAVLRADFDWDELPPETPPRVRRVLRRCLERDPKRRLHSIADARIELTDREEEPRHEPGPVAAASRSSWAAALPWAVAALAAALAVWAWLGDGRRADPPAPSVATILPPGGTTADAVSPPSISPDGRSVIIGALDEAGDVRLWLYSLADGSWRLLPGTEGGNRAFWSPASDSIGFFTDSELKVMRLEEGVPTVLTEVSGDRYSGVWGPDEEVLFVHRPGLFRIPSGGGTAVEVDPEAPGTQEFLALSLSPTGAHYSYLLRDYAGTSTKNEVWIASTTDDTSRLVLESNSGAAFAPSGDLVWWDGGHLWAQPLNLERLALTGERRLLRPQVQFDPQQAVAMFSIAGDGTLVFRSGSVVQGDELVLVDRQGRELRAVGPPGNYYNPRLSPDGQRIAVDRSDETNRGDIWLFDVDRGAGTRLTSAPQDESRPVWAPDGQQLAFYSWRQDGRNLHLLSPGKQNEEERIFGRPGEGISPTSWSTNGWIAMQTGGELLAGGDLMAWSAESSETVTIAATPYEERDARISPDARFVLYVSGETGRYEVYLQSFPVASSRTRVSTEGGYAPIWRADGREIFFAQGQSEIVAVPVLEAADGELPKLGSAEALFRSDSKAYGSHHHDTIDGRTFLLNRRVGVREQGPVTLVLNALPAGS